jgi:hypothetical protein
VTPHYRIVGRVGPVLGDIAAAEVDVIESLLARPRRGNRQRPFIDVDASHVPARTDQAGRQHRQLSDATAEIEHAVAGRQTGPPQELFRERIEN